MQKSFRIGLYNLSVCYAASALLPANAIEKPNVLFIAVDDLKPVLGCYGDALIKTPNIDRLAKNGTVFLSNYCQQAISGPTRASLMTGMRPDYTKVWDLQTKMRDVNPDILSIPQYFAANGYSTLGIGKIYDFRCVDQKQDLPSWSVPYYKTDKKFYSTATGLPGLWYQDPESKSAVKKYMEEGRANGLKENELGQYVMKKFRPSVEHLDLPDNAYVDGATALHSKEILIELNKNNKPFFFAVGFNQPHLPFVSPQKYWDMYSRDKMPLPAYTDKPVNGVAISAPVGSELITYTDIPQIVENTQQKDFGVTLPIEKQKELIHGYYASVSYIDAQVGILLNTLDSLGLSKNTIVVLWGDHGWHLGDHNLWCKHTNFEQAARSPLIIAAPGIKSSVSKSPSEFIDIFPTLCDLTNMKIPEQLHGTSQVAVMKNPKQKVKEFSVSQYPRFISKTEASKLGFSSSKVMGYSIRNERYRYTIWLGNDYRSNQPFDEKLVIDSELYDYELDPLETKNVVNEEKYASVNSALKKQMISFFTSQKYK